MPLELYAVLCNQGLVSAHAREEQALQEASRLLSSFPQVTVVRLCETGRTDLSAAPSSCPA